MNRALQSLFLATLMVLAATPARAGDVAAERMTPLVMSVPAAPVPFSGSDGRTHLVYEVWLSNFSSGDVAIEQVEVRSGEAVIASLDAAAIAARLQLAGERLSSATMAKSTQALLFLDVVLAPGSAVPSRLEHRISARFAAAPPGRQQLSETGAATLPDRREVVVIGPPLRGSGYISADSCCDSTRHMRAALPINGRVWLAQRFAVDWEQLDAQQRIYVGPREALGSYAIFGQPVIAVADARVVAVTDGHPGQVPGHYPKAISVDDADGNSIVLDLGGGNYALYAHLQPGSLKVQAGDRVRRGEVIALVGDSGNSLAPHLHFQVMDAPSSLAANGLPYRIDRYQITGRTPGTAAFDAAEADGTPLTVAPVTPPDMVRDALPLDQLIIGFEH